MSQEMIEELYMVALSDFRCARNEDDQWDARKRMAQLERTATLLYGTAYTKRLEERKTALRAFYDVTEVL